MLTGADVMALTSSLVVGVKAPLECWPIAVDRVRYVGEPVAIVVASDRYRAWLCENSTRYNRTRNFGLYGHSESRKTQKFVFRSALRPNQISFSHGQTPITTLSVGEAR